MEKFKDRTAKVERLFFELMKNRDKNIDSDEVRKKHNLDDDNEDIIENVFEVTSLENVSSRATQEFYTKSSCIENEVNDDVFEATTISQNEEFIIEQSIPSQSNIRKAPTIKRVEKSSKPQVQMKILNPTILPKIESKLRIELLNCDKCTHKTSTRQAMEKHMQLHIRNEKLFECGICQKKFSSKKVLKNHESIHLSSTERKLFECNICAKSLSSATAVNNHIKYFHSESCEFSCAVCDKKFKTVRVNFRSMNLFIIFQVFNFFISERITQRASKNSLNCKATRLCFVQERVQKCIDTLKSS